MSNVETIAQSLRVDIIEYNTDFPQVVVSFSLEQPGSPERLRLAVGFTVAGHDYYDSDLDEVHLPAVLGEYSMLNLSRDEVDQLIEKLENKLSDVYLLVASAIERTIEYQQDDLLSAANA